jgi:hypothetical protein
MLALGLFLAAGSKTFRFLVNRRWPEAIADVATIALVPKLRCQPSSLGSPWPSRLHLPWTASWITTYASERMTALLP